MATTALRHVLAGRGQFPNAARPPMRPSVGRRLKAFAKSWAFGCNSSKIQALEARCNHSYKHQSIAGVKEQGVYLSTLATCPGRHRKGQQNGFLPTSTAIALRNLQDHHISALQASDLRRSRNALVRRLVQSQNTHCKQWPGPGALDA